MQLDNTPTRPALSARVQVLLCRVGFKLVPQRSCQTVRDHHPDDHLRQLRGLSRLHPLPRGRLQRHQLQPGE